MLCMHMHVCVLKEFVMCYFPPDQCIRVHFNLPYKWEVFDGTCWRDLRRMEDIERAYCDPRNTHRSEVNSLHQEC